MDDVLIEVGLISVVKFCDRKNRSIIRVEVVLNSIRLTYLFHKIYVFCLCNRAHTNYEQRLVNI